jgi:hypothetical protein
MKTLPPRIARLLFAVPLFVLLALGACSSDDEPTTAVTVPAPDQRLLLLSEEVPPLALDLEAIAGLVAAGLPGDDPDVTPVYDEAAGTWSWTRAESETDSLMLGRRERTLEVVVGYRAGETAVRDRADADRVEVAVGLDFLLEDYDPDTGAKTYAARTMTLDLDLADDALAPGSIRLSGSGAGLIQGGISTSGTDWRRGFLDQVAATCDLIFPATRCPDGQLRLDMDGDLFTVSADSSASRATWRYLGSTATGSFDWGCAPPPADSE